MKDKRGGGVRPPPRHLPERAFHEAFFQGKVAVRRRRAILPLLKILLKVAPGVKAPISLDFDFRDLADPKEFPMTKSENHNSGSREIPVKVVREFSLSDDGLRHQRIAEKAHELYQCRGCCHGHDLDDWLEAERLVLGEIALQAHGKAQKPQPRGQRSKKG